MKEKLIGLLNEYHNKYNCFPIKKYMCEMLKIDNTQLSMLLYELEKEEIIKKYNNKYFLNKKSEIKKEEDKLEKQVNKNINTKIIFNPIFLIKILMVIISISATIISIYYSWFWLSNYLNMFFSILLACTMIIYDVIAVQFLIFVKSNILKSFIIFTVGVVILFSMVSTIAGQYNSRIINAEKEIEESIEITHDRLIYENMKIQEKELINEIEIKIQERISFQKILASIDTVEKRKEDSPVFWDAKNNLKIIEDNLKENRKKLEDIRLKINEYLSTTKEVGAIEKEENKSFYVWVSSIFGVSIDIIEFWLSLFPALFIDIIAPFGLMLALRNARNTKT